MPGTTNIAEEITRLTDSRNTIRNKMVNFGLAEAAAKLDVLAQAVNGIANCGAVSAEVQEGDTYTIPKGYHNGSGFYGLSDVTVAAIPAAYQDVSSVTATAGDVLANKIIVTADGQVTTGTMPNNGAVSQKLDAEKPSYTVPAGYHDGKGTVSVTTETKTATPTKEQQTVSATEGKVLSSVTVEAIPPQYLDTSDATAAASQILAGQTAYAGGAKVTGTMANNGATALELDGMQATSVAIPAGYTSGGTVTLTNSIEEALAAI